MPFDIIVQLASNLIYIAAIIAIVYFTLKIFRNAPGKPPAAAGPKVVSRPLMDLFIECRYDVRMVQGWKYQVSTVIYPMNTDSVEQLLESHVTGIRSLSLESASFDVIQLQTPSGPLSASGLRASWLLTPVIPGNVSFRLLVEVDKLGEDPELLKVLFSDVYVRRNYARWLKWGDKKQMA
ncbi:hypothetical protein MKQ68_07270 [Chitinophaga horti]|uniref:DUF4230 domain-containing protein n=1 Tax=Chitinophaga horti TaxID=2920382 RepID=A0ABY6J6A8_9BACT|nr:hypothetical protein [Chitinophaga horti]UYQ94891.1 hypothetical protein MKQ68_07270 [Chitinophaga horti]